jgi:hypothetical protein
MHYGIAKILLSVALTVALISSPVWSETSYTAERSTEEVSAGEIAFDALLIRPAGIVATAVGAAIFIVSLPFGLLSGSTEEAAQKLVREPADYTFVRPLGQGIKPTPIDE